MKMKKSRILVVGSSNTDMIVQLRKLPGPGETVINGKFSTAPGGKGANQAVGAARAGGSVTFIGRVGSDDFWASALANLARDGIDVSRVVRDPSAPSGVAFICVAVGGENSIAVASGANEQLSAADVRRAAAAFAGAAVVLAQLETPLASVVAAAAEARRVGATLILNPAPARALPDSLLRRVSILTPNEVEATALTGLPVDNEKSAAKAARRLLERGPRTVIITLGSRGALVADADGIDLLPGFKVTAVDTTAAGDVFSGALAVGLAEGRKLRAAVGFAQAAAAISVTRLGAQTSAPTRREIEAWLKRYT